MARQSNATFLTKLGWRVITEPNALWSRVIRNKYYKGLCDLDMFVTKANMSNVWRGITNNASNVWKGSKVVVSNGMTMLFWDHKWATDFPLSDLAT